MALFHVMAFDKPDSLSVRMDNRPAHLDWIGGHLDKVKLAGPMLNEAGEAPIGSVLMIQIENRAALDAFLLEDPYAKAELFQRVEVKPFKWVIGAPDGLE